MRASDIKKGQAVIIDGKLYVVTNADHNTPGNLRAKVQFKLRDVAKGTIQDKRVGATDDIETTTLDSRNVEYLYSDNDGHVLMDLETYEQITVPEKSVSEALQWIVPNENVDVLYVDEEPADLQVPSAVELAVTETEPGVRGDTASGGGDKPAVLESGVTVRVPLFVNVGDRVRVDTRSGEYVSRA